MKNSWRVFGQVIKHLCVEDLKAFLWNLSHNSRALVGINMGDEAKTLLVLIMDRVPASQEDLSKNPVAAFVRVDAEGSRAIGEVD